MTAPAMRPTTTVRVDPLTVEANVAGRGSAVPLKKMADQAVAEEDGVAAATVHDLEHAGARQLHLVERLHGGQQADHAVGGELEAVHVEDVRADVAV